MSNESSSSNDKKEQNATSSSSTSSWFGSLLSLKQQWEEFDDGQRINRLKACQILDEILNNCQQKQIAQQQQQQNPSQQQQQSSQQQQNDDVDDPIESVSIGLRNMKYFGWRGILSSKKSADTDTDTDEITKIQDENGNSNASTNGNEITNNDEHEKNQLLFHSKIRQSCSREQHAVWACRSVSTGCGKDLSQLKRCFEDIDTDTDTEIEKLPPHYRILTAPYTNYEGIVEKTEEEAQAQSLATMTTTTTSVDNSKSLSSSLASLKQRIPCYDIQRQLGSCVTINGKQLLERKQKREENNK
ncbi:hypothetical protein FRACYDRAFT_233491 [Fragilariopsis cylindrus CCMP1102]|uniref:Uncharacterized protein n=1 Tax=Fragilariopsis cylindrus CCMP1102 TaxID=635003 RepID=A0A1E7FYU5_9STRA|nr:hypothetical protein FRACYDRAFT_233491 [Fragilariopsis cylindrus CCMP1102]|eukprot:OEU23320.1 hypothetical protein FRACYDRAFT_233491 [Fragilariopsis cylindrus CCMP1102]